MCTKFACLRRNSIAAGPKPTLDAEAIYGLIRKHAMTYVSTYSRHKNN